MEIAAKKYPIDTLNIKQKDFDKRALKIAKRLHAIGFDAYLVGGCLRDSLLGIAPKDFDIATNARPEEIKQSFKNCRLIGKRFRLAHILFGRNDIIEVATFRSASAQPQEQDGYLKRDNHYGTLEEDVIRRDFTMNSLYFDPKTNELIDHLNAIEDINKRLIRLIGEPKLRYQEDPVRMLRAARFMAKLNMHLEENTHKAIADCRALLHAIPPARLFDESQKLFLSGFGLKSYKTLKSLDLFETLFPDVTRVLKNATPDFNHYGEKIIENALNNTDKRIKEEKPVTIAFLFAAFLWPVFQAQYRGLLQERRDWYSAMNESIDIVLIAASERVSIPLRLRSMVREIWSLQARLENQKRTPQRVENILSQSRFRAAYDFLELRVHSGEHKLKNTLQFWQEAQ